MQYENTKAAHLLSYFKTLGPTYGLNPRSPARKSDAQPTEPPVVGFEHCERVLTEKEIGVKDKQKRTALQFAAPHKV